MFDYTKMVLEKTIKDIKSVAYISNVATQVTSLIYLIYTLIAGKGFWYVNALLLALSTAYFIYFLHSSNHESKNKQLDKKLRKLYARIKQVIKLFPLAVALYSLCLTVENVNPFTLISTAFMLITWLLQLIFDVLSTIIGKRFALFVEAIEADVDEFKKPVKSVENFFKRVSGKEIEEKAPSKNRVWLDQQITDYRESKAEKKRLAQEEKRQHKKEVFEEKKRKFLSKKAERKLLQSSKRTLNHEEIKSLPAPQNDSEEILNNEE